MVFREVEKNCNKKTQIETSREDLSIESENESLLEVRITESTRNEENTLRTNSSKSSKPLLVLRKEWMNKSKWKAQHNTTQHNKL